MNGAEYLVKFFENKGVEYIFGYPGGKVIFLYDVLGKSPLKHILTRHEQGAVHAADGYARVTGRPGVCIATSGPGATNLVTGLANAYLDSVPLIAVTGQVGLMISGGIPSRSRYHGIPCRLPSTVIWSKKWNCCRP